MPKSTPQRKPCVKTSHCKRWKITAILIILIVSDTYLLHAYLAHDADAPLCGCIRCLLTHTPEEGEYVYNRYLFFISLGWITLLFAVILLMNQYLVKKNKNR